MLENFHFEGFLGGFKIILSSNLDLIRGFHKVHEKVNINFANFLLPQPA